MDEKTKENTFFMNYAEDGRVVEVTIPAITRWYSILAYLNGQHSQENFLVPYESLSKKHKDRWQCILHRDGFIFDPQIDPYVELVAPDATCGHNLHIVTRMVATKRVDVSTPTQLPGKGHTYVYPTPAHGITYMELELVRWWLSDSKEHEEEHKDDTNVTLEQLLDSFKKEGCSRVSPLFSSVDELYGADVDPATHIVAIKNNKVYIRDTYVYCEVFAIFVSGGTAIPMPP